MELGTEDDVIDVMPTVLLRIIYDYCRSRQYDGELYPPRRSYNYNMSSLCGSLNRHTTIQKFKELCRTRNVSAQNFDELTFGTYNNNIMCYLLSERNFLLAEFVMKEYEALAFNDSAWRDDEDGNRQRPSLSHINCGIGGEQKSFLCLLPRFHYGEEDALTLLRTTVTHVPAMIRAPLKFFHDDSPLQTSVSQFYQTARPDWTRFLAALADLDT